jgi:hypothetical protein
MTAFPRTAAAPVALPVLSGFLRWQEPVANRLRHRHALPGRVANRLLNIELGLFLLNDLLPLAPAEALPNLLNGQGAVYRDRPVWTPRQYRQLSRARVLLAPYQHRAVWQAALTRYATLPADLRLFAVSGRGGWNAGLSSQSQRERLDLFRKALV